MSEFDSVIGKTGAEAVTTIKSQAPEVNAVVVPEGSMVTMDYREDRVRVWVNPEGKVVQVTRG